MLLRALIVDDEKPARKKIRVFLEMDPEIEIIGECENGQEALAMLRQDNTDLLFLDIQMPHLDGFALLKRSVTQRPRAVIFITAYDEYAVKAFEESAADYLLKPFTRKRFEAAVRKAKDQLRQKKIAVPAEQVAALLDQLRNNKYVSRVAIKSQDGIRLLPCDQIDWIESQDNYVVVHAGRESHLLRQSLAAIEKQLDPSRFLRIHRRILVNSDRILELDRQRQTRLVLQGGALLPISRRLKQKVKRFLLDRRC